MPARPDRPRRHRQSRAIPRLRRQLADHEADDLSQRRRALNPLAKHSSIFSRRAEHESFEYQADWFPAFQIDRGFVRAGGLTPAMFLAEAAPLGALTKLRRPLP